MNKEQLNQFLKSISPGSFQKENLKYNRYGQFVFNKLFDICPKFARTFVDTEIDPYYDDSRVDDFICNIITIVEKENG